MNGIPYVERRRQRFYLRVRTPADILALTGKDFFTKSLRTSDPRRARAEAARQLAELHAAWQEVRFNVIKIMGKPLDQLTGDDVPLIRLTDLNGLSDAQRGAVLERLDLLLAGERLEAATAEAEAAKLGAQVAEIQSVTSALNHEIAQRQTNTLGALLAQALAAGPAAPVARPMHKDTRQPWHDRVDAFFADRPSVGPKAQISYRQAFAQFRELVGDKNLGEITKSDVKSFADYLRDKPINRAGRERMSRANIVKLLGHIKTYFGWNAEAGVIITNPADGVQPRTETRQERDGKTQRRPFEINELERLFDSPLFTGCKSIGRRSAPGKQIFRDEPFWFFLIAFATGARTDEIAEMPSQFISVGNVLCFDFTHATKTSAGPRLIPVLPELKKIGIEHWASDQSRRGRGMVQGPNSSADWSKWTNRYLDNIGLTDPLLVGYSLRHNFRQQLRAANLHPEIVDKVFGHEGESVGAGYGRPLSPDEARLVAESVRLPVHLDHLYPLL